MFTTLDTLRQEGADANYADQLKEEIAQTDELANKIASRGVERGEALKRAVKLQADNMRAPFGGYKQSGNGREYGEFGVRDFLEIKSISGFRPV